MNGFDTIEPKFHVSGNNKDMIKKIEKKLSLIEIDNSSKKRSLQISKKSQNNN